MSIAVRFACGHQTTVGANADTPPTCGCGETRIVRVAARAPRFTGACSGPYCETQAIEPGVVNVAPGGTLRLKESDSG
jgi:hypothetical protein